MWNVAAAPSVAPPAPASPPPPLPPVRPPLLPPPPQQPDEAPSPPPSADAADTVTDKAVPGTFWRMYCCCCLCSSRPNPRFPHPLFISVSFPALTPFVNSSHSTFAIGYQAYTLSPLRERLLDRLLGRRSSHRHSRRLVRSRLHFSLCSIEDCLHICQTRIALFADRSPQSLDESLLA